MIRNSARAFVLLAVIAGWGYAAGDRLAVPLLSAAHAAASPARGSEYDLAALSIFNRVVVLVSENYYDPKRIAPRKMLLDSLDYVEKSVAEVMVDPSPDQKRVKVTVAAQSREFEIADVDSIYKMSMRLHQVMAFVQQNLTSTRKADDVREVEYALVNGMLSSLDPHSVLLKPEHYKEMKLSTKGEFGGLGFVISMREGELTVMKVLKGTRDNPTPAMKAGIKPKDRIVRIGDESTVNMELNGAVERLRGKPGSKVSITIARAAWPEPRQLTVSRALIEIESVEAKLLPKGVGWIRIKNFQGNTARDLATSISSLRAQSGGKLQGLVLDMRGNPGGLLEQAIQVSDVFLDQGTIVTTVGMSDKLREVKRAREGGDTQLPVVVLVNNGSASASEIVAGALKNLDRAVIVGRTTFGKGSVQVLYDNFPDESALKLTIAQYLTPGDLSIQETGITPDIELLAARVTKDQISVFAPARSMREADLDHHLSNPNAPLPALEAAQQQARTRERALHELRYLREDNDKAPPAEGDEEEAEEPDELKEDFQVLFARDLLLAAPHPTRAEMLRAAGPFLAGRGAAEEARIVQEIEKLGVDWASGSAAGGLAKATLSPAPDAKLRAGEKIPLQLTVTNTGTAPLFRVRAWTEVKGNPLLDRREFLLGRLEPGAAKSWSVPIELPRDLASRRDDVRVRIEDGSGSFLGEARGEFAVLELPRPRFAFSYQILDKAGDGDSMPDPGEKLLVQVDIRNVGDGPSSEVTFASLKNEGDEKVFIEKGRSKLGTLEPGKGAQAIFELELKKGYTGETMPVRLVLFDEKLEELLVETLQVPVDLGGRIVVEPVKGSLRLADEALVRAGPWAEAPVLATAKKGAVLEADGRTLDGWVRVAFAKGRSGFVRSSDKLGAAGRGSLQLVEAQSWHVPPKITFDTEGGAATDGDRYSLSGAVEDPALRDLYVFVNDQKVYFATGTSAEPRHRFKADFPLKPGTNHVVVVARQGDELTARRAFTVLRRDPPMAATAGGQP